MDIFKFLSNLLEAILLFLKRDNSPEFKDRESKQQDVDKQDEVELLVAQIKNSKDEKERNKLLQKLRAIVAA